MAKRFVRSLVLLAALLGGAIGASQAADSFVITNPATGQTESVWSAVPLGGLSEIYFAILEGTEWSPSEQLTSNSSTDQNPHLAYAPSGDRYAVWWQDDTVDGVHVRERLESEETWDAPVEISDGVEDARHPRAIVHAGDIYIAYESVPATGDRDIIMGKLHDPTPGGISRSTVATSSQSSALSIRLHSESGTLWVDWVDSGTNLGWSKLVNGSWTAASYEPYTGPADIGPGRGRIRATVLDL